MRFILICLFLGLATAIVAALAFGSRLPTDHVATVRAHFTAPIAKVWDVIHDPLAATSWRTDLTAVTKRDDPSGLLAWREKFKHNEIDYLMTEAVPMTRQVNRITNTDLPYGGQWEFTLTAANGGTDLAITERGFVKPAIFRLISRYVMGYTGTLDAYLRALGTHLGETVTPTVVSAGY